MNLQHDYTTVLVIGTFTVVLLFFIFLFFHFIVKRHYLYAFFQALVLCAHVYVFLGVIGVFG